MKKVTIFKSFAMFQLFFYIIGIFSLSYAKCPSKEINVSFADMTKSATFNIKTKKLEGAFVRMFNFLEKKTSLKFKKNIYPFKRSLNNVIDKNDDIHIPLIRNPEDNPEKLPYILSRFTLFKVPFVLYTRKDKKIDYKRLGKYNITTDRAHTRFLPFKSTGSHCIDCNLKKLSNGRIDGYIFAQAEVDHLIKKLQLKNIRRTLYKNFEVKLVFQKNKKGKILEKCISKTLNLLKDEKGFKKSLEVLIGDYNNWQP